MATYVTLIPSETLRDIRARVFRRRESTLLEEAARYSLADYEVTLTSIRNEMSVVIETLPNEAFELQIANDDPVWSVGEIVGHLRHAQMNIFLRVARAVAGLPPGPEAHRPDEDGVFPALSRFASLAALDEANRDMAAFFRSIPIDMDLTRTIIDRQFGNVALRDMLLFLAIHEDDHLGQVRELRVPMPAAFHA